MSNTAKLSISSLDFDLVKSGLRDYLRSQTAFKDFDFTGSGLSVLLDVLAYNTHYSAFYTNMVANEMFLDSAVLRSSVVSLAKHLGYTPRSVTSAQAQLQIIITPTDSAVSAVIPVNTPFSSSVDGTAFTFVTSQTYGAILDSSTSTFIFDNVSLVQGVPYTYRYVVDNSIYHQRFVLPSAAIDTSFLQVRVQRSLTDTTSVTYVASGSLLEILGDSPVYFLQEVENQTFELVFGDGVIGRPLADGNVLFVSYFISAGSASNGAATFVPAATLSGYSAHSTNITTLVPAAGGKDAETIDSIRFSAPKNYETQARAVTASDYELIVTEDYTNADSVAVWGGEDNVPPQYGKVFISIKPVNGFVLTNQIKSSIASSILRKRNIVTVIPELVDPDYTYLVVNTRVKYNPSNSTKSEGDIRNGAYNAIIAFTVAEIDKFETEFRFSRFLSAIDNSDPSITSNLSTIRLKKIFLPVFDVPSNYDFDYNSAVQPGSMTSSVFVVVNDPRLLSPYRTGNTYSLTDDANGTVQMIQHGIGLPDVIIRRAGTINYITGHVVLSLFSPNSGDASGEISIIVTPQENDIVPVRNNILFIKPEDIAVSVIPVA